MDEMIKEYNISIKILINKLEKICNDEKLLNDYFVELEEKNNIAYIVDTEGRYCDSIICEIIELNDKPIFKDFIGVNIHLGNRDISTAGLNKNKLRSIIVNYRIPPRIAGVLEKKAINEFFKKVKDGTF